MWKTCKIIMYEVYDDKDNRLIATNLDENQAQSIVDKHNAELSDKKWDKGIKQQRDC